MFSTSRAIANHIADYVEEKAAKACISKSKQARLNISTAKQDSIKDYPNMEVLESMSNDKDITVHIITIDLSQQTSNSADPSQVKTKQLMFKGTFQQEEPIASRTRSKANS